MTSARGRLPVSFLVAVLALVLLGPVAPVSAAPVATGSVSGTVTVPTGHSTAGLRATQVVLVQDHDGQAWQEGASVPVAPDGSYVIETSTDSEYVVRFTDPSGVLGSVYNGTGHHLEYAQRYRGASAVHTGVDARMVEASSISGRVVGLDGSTPRAGARVLAHRQEESTGAWRRMETPTSHGWVTADELGRFTVADLPPGSYRLLVASGWAPTNWYPNVERPEDATTLVLEAGQAYSGVEARIVGHTSVSGRVLAQDGTPRAGAVVTAHRQEGENWGQAFPYPDSQVLTDALGRFTILDLPPGNFRFLARGAGSPDTWYPGVGLSEVATTIVLTAGEIRTGVDIRTVPTATPQPAAPTKIKRLKSPTLKGVVKVGRTVKVTRGTWKPGKVKITYRWSAVKAAKGAKPRVLKTGTKQRLRLTRSLRGSKVRAKVTVKAPGHRTVTYTTKWSTKVR